MEEGENNQYVYIKSWMRSKVDENPRKKPPQCTVLHGTIFLCVHVLKRVHIKTKSTCLAQGV